VVTGYGVATVGLIALAYLVRSVGFALLATAVLALLFFKPGGVGRGDLSRKYLCNYLCPPAAGWMMRTLR
jgi:hypothetical protein